MMKMITNISRLSFVKLNALYIIEKDIRLKILLLYGGRNYE